MVPKLGIFLICVFICVSEEVYIPVSWSRAIMAPIVRQVKSKPALPQKAAAQKPAQKPTHKPVVQKIVQKALVQKTVQKRAIHSVQSAGPNYPKKVVPAEKTSLPSSEAMPSREVFDDGELKVIADQIQTIQKQKKMLEEKRKALFNIFLNTQLFFANKTATDKRQLALTALGLSAHESEDFVHRSILAKLCSNAPSQRLFWFARQFQNIHTTMTHYSQQEQRLMALYQKKSQEKENKILPKK